MKWSAIQSLIESEFSDISELGKHKLAFEALDSGVRRGQMVVLEKRSYLRTDFLVLSSPFAKEAIVDGNDVIMSKTYESQPFGLDFSNGYWHLKTSLVGEDVNKNDLLSAIQSLAETADKFEVKFGAAGAL
jgi:hypothetical protein